MADWKGGILTTKGKALAAKVEAGTCKLTLTKLKVGDGSPTELEALTDLASPKQNIGISNIVASDDGTCDVEGVLTNEDLTSGYYLRELGLFATDPDDGEILYAVTTDNNPDYLQANSSATALSMAIHMTIVITSADSVAAVLNPAGLLTQKDLAAHNVATDAHDNKYILTATANQPSEMMDNGTWVEVLE